MNMQVDVVIAVLVAVGALVAFFSKGTVVPSHLKNYIAIVGLIAAGYALVKLLHPGTMTFNSTTLHASPPMNELFTNASGLQYSIINHGSGQTTPTPGSTVTVNYTGWLSDGGNPGKQFDSSIGRGPFSFVVGAGRVIKGWDEGLLQMKVGEKRRLIIPSQLGYGKSGYPGLIPPDATLIFDVELLSFK